MQVATVMHPMQHAGGVATYYATPRPTHPHYSSVNFHDYSASYSKAQRAQLGTGYNSTGTAAGATAQGLNNHASFGGGKSATLPGHHSGPPGMTGNYASGAPTQYHTHHRATAGWNSAPLPAQQYHRSYGTGPVSQTAAMSPYTSYNPNPTTYNNSNNRIPTASSPANTNNSSSSSNTNGGTSLQSSNQPTTSSPSSECQSGAPAQQLSKTNLYIRGLNQNTTDKDLITMCSQYGTIVSTKAILDKNTNKCYGFVDFESGTCADAAVKGLQAKGVQAQMAKVGIPVQRRAATQEQDPTNLYIANLPPNFKENDLDTLLSKFGQVVSTRILRDTNMVSKGVGFARMDSKEKCEQIIQMFNGNPLPGSKEPLLVKFADSGQKKRNPSYRSDSRLWRETENGGCMRFPVQHYMLQGSHVGYDATHNGLNGAAGAHVIPASLAQYVGRHYTTQPLPAHGYSIPASATWLPQYVMQPAPPHHLAQIDTPVCCQMIQQPDPSSVQYGSVIPQLATHMSTLQIGNGSYVASPHPAYPYFASTAPNIIHTVPIPAEDHPSTTASPDDSYQHYSHK